MVSKSKHGGVIWICLVLLSQFVVIHLHNMSWPVLRNKLDLHIVSVGIANVPLTKCK